MDILEQKLNILIDEMGCDDLEQMLAEACTDSVVLGICFNLGCDYTIEVEPDCSDGHCDVCGTHTVRSPLIAIGII